MRNRTVVYFEGKLSQILSSNPNIQDIHELAIKALFGQKHSDINNFYLDCALERLIVEKKIIHHYESITRISLAA